MDYPGVDMELTLTQDAKVFIEEWRNPLPYVIAHTSGSTGKPKEIRLLKDDMRASAHATIEFFNLDCHSLLYLPLSPSYIAGKMQIVRALEAGCSLTVETPSNHPSLEITNGDEISLLPIVPSQVDAVLASERRRSIGTMIIGGAPLPRKAEKRIIASGIKAYATYGMTETCSHVALRRLGTEKFESLPGFSFSLDNRGCLIITSEKLSFSTLTTNDIVELSSPTSFKWLGRYDNVINSGGIKIFPEEIERQIAPVMPCGAHFYITSRPSAKWGEELILVTNDNRIDMHILDRIRQLVGSKHTPKAVITDSEIKFTASQKIIRRKFLS
ncbi:MAG: AMP-binding protein [Bacteroides sp.]|nr:AMP-binding protein [Bacteroides sp.]